MSWKKSNSDNDNVVSLKDHKKTKKSSNGHDAPSTLSEESVPLINLPKGIKTFAGLLLAIHVGLWAISHLSNDNMLFWAIAHWGFLPARFTGGIDFLPYTILTPVTYALFHGGWAHILMNTVMLAAFGAGFEKMLGLKKLMLVFWGATVIAAGVHFLLDPYSMVPMVGASGGISGLFAGLILIMHKSGRLAPNKKLMPVIFVFVGISLAFGLLGGPGGSIIAWAAHIGGFLGGLLLTHIILKKG